MKMGGGFSKMGGFRRMGGFKRLPPITFRMLNTKAVLTGASQSTNYSNSNYLASYALQNNNKFTHTKKGVNQWWKASFVGGEQWVWKVRIQNRVDCCGGRLKGTKVMIGGQQCG